MKKFLCLLCVLAVGAGAFATKLGLDFSLGTGFGLQNAKFEVLGEEVTYEQMDWAAISIKVATYDFFWLDDMLGLHAQLGFSPFVVNGGTLKLEGSEFELKGGQSGVPTEYRGIEFLVGPAFGIDLHELIRFQMGLGFHFFRARSWEDFTYTEDVGSSTSMSVSFSSYGIGLTPQLRFTPHKRLSFLVGCDLYFDFGGSIMEYFSYELAGKDMLWKLPDDMTGFFRFGLSPYIGVGINF